MEFSTEEITWLADRLHDLRQGWTAAAVFKAAGIQQRGEASDNERQMLEQLEEHRRMEAVLRNRLLNKASQQGFGEL